MKTLKTVGLTSALALALTGCSMGASGGEPELTAQDVSEELQCVMLMEDTPTSPELLKTYSCTSLDGDGPMVFMFEAESNDKLNEWLDSGGLEVGATDVVYGLGNLALLAMDKGQGIETQLEELFGPAIIE